MTLRTRITLVAIVVTLLVAISLIVTAHVSQSQVEDRFTAATNDGKSVLWRKIVSSQLDHMVTGTTSLARDRATRKALINKDIAVLADNAKTTFNLLEAQHILSKLQITDLDSQVLFSAPDNYRGKTKKGLVAQAMQEGKITRGVEVDDNGELIAVVAFPLLKRGKPVGAGVYARNLQDAINDFKTNDGSETIIVDGKGRDVLATQDGLFTKLNVELPALGTSNVQVAKLDGAVYSVATQPVMDAYGKPVAHLVSVKDYTQSYAAQQTFTLVAYSAIALVLVLALAALYWYMQRSLSPLQGLATALNGIAEGDLNQTIEVKSNDEIGQLQSAMKAMIETLHSMIGSINEMTAQLTSSAAGMTQITNETRQGVEQQQMQTDQVATAMNEMTATVQEVARHAGDAAGAAKHADEESNAGSKVVNDTIQAINHLAGEVERASEVIHKVEEDSDNIGAVLDVIKGIAEQTNLLALNAAIEAARAGEQGRGFAVVADEVRTLASRTQSSTEEIEKMIEQLQQGARNAVKVMKDSSDRAQSGVEQAAQAGSSLSTITQAVGTISAMNLQIASAAEEQSSVAEEINRSIVSISEVAEMSAVSADKTAASTDELNALAQRLSELVRRFDI